MVRIILLVAVTASMFVVSTASAAQQTRSSRSAAQSTRKGPISKLIELERRKNEWLRETFLNNR